MKNKRIVSGVLVIILILSLLTPGFAESVSDNSGNTEAERKAAFARAMQDQDIPKMVENMTIEEKIAQTFMMDFREWNYDGKEQKDMEELPEEVANLIEKYHFGSIILYSNNLITTEKTFQLIKNMQKSVTKNNGIPMIMSTDQEGGNIFHLNFGTALPGNMAIAATGNPDNAQKTGQIIGKELSSLGINTTLAPVMDVNNNPENPIIGLRSFSDDPETVSQYGAAEIRGLSETGVISCAKHFPGHGDTNVDSHTGLPIINKTLDELKKLELIPFQKAIDAGVDMIMTTHILYPQVDNTTIFSEKINTEVNRPATLSKTILTDMLKDDMHFQGVVVTDGMVMEGISGQFNDDQAIIESLKAGADMICQPVFGFYTETEAIQKINGVIEAVKKSVLSESEDSLTMDRLDDAVTRILTLKKNKGILDYDPDAHTVQEALKTVGNAEHRALEREMASQGITIVKNNNQTLPYKVEENAKVLMVCPKSTSNPLPASMIMGWNRAKSAGLIPDSAEVRTHVFTDEAYHVEGDFQKALDWADAVIVISEMVTNSYLTDCPREVTDYCSEKGKKSIVLSILDPYDAQFYPNADAIAVAYGYRGSQLDPDEVLTKGTTESKEAFGPNVVAGIEVILGTFGASGKLPVAIPRYDANTETFDLSDMVYDRGYGLTYAAFDHSNLASEQSHAPLLFILPAIGIIMILTAILILVRSKRKK